MDENKKADLIAKALIAHEHYDYLDAALLAGEIDNYYPEDVKQLVLDWAKTGICPQRDIYGLTIAMIQKTLHVNLGEAFRFMNLYLSNPRKATTILNAYERRIK